MQQQVFQLPSVIAISIAATRIHRSLTEFAYTATSSYNLCDTTLFLLSSSSLWSRYRRSPRILDSSRGPVSSADRAQARAAVMPAPVPLNHMEMAVHKTYKRYETGPTSHHVSFVVAGGEPLNKLVAGPVADVEEESASAETGPVTDAEFESNAETSYTGTNPQNSAMGTTNV